MNISTQKIGQDYAFSPDDSFFHNEVYKFAVYNC